MTLRDLGRQAFARYLAQLAPYMRVALTSGAAAARAGLWGDGAAVVGNLLRARMPDGSVALALTCATCHTAPGPDARLAPGLPNAALDIGRTDLKAQGIPAASSHDACAAWGPGRLAVSTSAGTEPARIPGLRPVRWLTHLHQDATFRGADPVTLAIGSESLIITASNQATRPPCPIALALAAYVSARWLTICRLPRRRLPRRRTARRCSRRAAPAATRRPGFTGAPVRLAAIGTDPTLGLSRDRGTRAYRVPSLRGVGTRGPCCTTPACLRVRRAGPGAPHPRNRSPRPDRVPAKPLTTRTTS